MTDSSEERLLLSLFILMMMMNTVIHPAVRLRLLSVPGQERETGQSSGKIPSHWVELSAATPRRPDLDLGFEPEGSASPHRPYQPWAETLHALLDDRDGTALFLRFLQPLGCSDLLEFWFACSGFQKVPEDTPGQRLKLAKAIYRCYLSEDGSTVVSRRVSAETRSCVWESIQQLHPTPSLFVQPQMEVEAVLEQSLFPVFLRSDIYFKLAQTSSQSPRKVPSPGSQERALPKYLPLQEKEAEPETIPPYNAANQKSRGNQVHSRRHHACHQHRRPTRERDTRHRHLPHTPMENVLMDSQTFTAELIRRLQELQRETQTHNLPAEEEDDASNVTSTCNSRKIEAGPAHSLCYYDTECTISQWHDTREETMKSIVIEQVKSVLSPDQRSTTSPHTHTHFTDMPDSTQTETWNYGSACESVTVVYFFCGELIPYRTSVKGTLVTLSQFKTLLIRTGRYRFYFKRASAEFDCGVVYEEISEDDAVLPIFEEKIIGKVERMME